MGFRLSKRIKICKGVNLNISKSGVGISLGGRGASISTGPRGTYINTGISGTGISYSKKIFSQSSMTTYNEKTIEMNNIHGSTFRIKIDDNGNETFLLIDSSGRPFSNETLEKKIKKTYLYKESLEKARKIRHDFIKKQNDVIIFIYKSTPKTITVDDVIKERDDTSSIQQNYYYVKSFEEPQPREVSFYDEALKFAQSTVKTYKFWKKKQLIREATYKKLDELYKIAMKEWTSRQDTHFENEKRIKLEKDAEYKKEYEKLLVERKKTYDLILNPSDEYLQDTIKDVLSQIELPVDFAVDYAISGLNIEVDIDLPEIEDFPKLTSSILQSGKLSIKNKKTVDLNRDYATSVVGLSFFFAGVIFNISPMIENITLSGYTQRLNKKTGNIEDQYVYSITYDRKNFSSLNIENIDPLEAIKNFDNKIDITSKFELKTIEVKQSDNRKSTSESQEIQTEYYKV